MLYLTYIRGEVAADRQRVDAIGNRLAIADGVSSTDPALRSGCQRRTRRSRKALLITDTELKLMAAAAMIGLSSRPVNG